MKALKTAERAFGPFRLIELLADHWMCDGNKLPFAVVGLDAVIVDADAVVWPVDPAATAAEALRLQKIADATAAAEAKADNVIQYLRDHTPAECESYVQAQVTDLATARAMMKKFAVALCVLAKQQLR